MPSGPKGKVPKEGLTHELTLYGDCLTKVRYLRSHGWVVYAEPEMPGYFRVGTKLMTRGGLLDTYRRVHSLNERRDQAMAAERAQRAAEAGADRPARIRKRSAARVRRH